MALGTTASTSDIEHVIAELRSEFIDDAIDHINSSYDRLKVAQDNNDKLEENILRIKRHVHSLKGQGGSFGFPSVSNIMHNLEDYFETLYEVNAECLTHIRPYLDVTSDIIENQDEPSVESLRKIISRLRVADETFGSGQELKDIPALLVMGTGVQRSLVGKELVSCGFRVVTSHNPIEAIGVAISAKPKFAIINKLLPGISGVELTHIFKALDTLSDCKIILLTSDNDANAIQQTIPDNSIVMHKDAKFYENLTDQLIDWGLFGDFA